MNKAVGLDPKTYGLGAGIFIGFISRCRAISPCSVSART
jgi:hypothetical protein